MELNSSYDAEDQWLLKLCQLEIFDPTNLRYTTNPSDGSNCPSKGGKWTRNMSTMPTSRLSPRVSAAAAVRSSLHLDFSCVKRENVA